MTLANRGPQDSRRSLAGDGEFRREVFDIERPTGRRIRCGMDQREIAGFEPSGVREKVQTGDEEHECAQGGGRDADDLLEHGPGPAKTAPTPARASETVPRS